MYTSSSTLLRRLAVLCILLVGWAVWGTQDGQSQCLACYEEPGEYCWIVPGAILGWDECSCNPGCRCRYECWYWLGAATDLRDLKEGRAELLASGQRLTTMPSKRYLSSLDTAASETGEMIEHVYFGEDFGMVLLKKDLAVVYQLEEPNVLAIRGCSGELVAHAYRVETTAEMTDLE